MTRATQPVTAPLPHTPHLGSTTHRGNRPTSTETNPLRALLRRPDIWQGFRNHSIGNQRTGHPLLDRHLPGRGWPDSGLIELLQPHPGIGEMQLLVPSLQSRTQCWVAPPFHPYAPALAQCGIDPNRLLILQPNSGADTLWALEQVLRAGSEDVVLGWCAQTPMATLRRLQLAAESTQTRLFLFRPAALLSQPSPATLRLHLTPQSEGLHLRILKSRGGRPHSFLLPLSMPTRAPIRPRMHNPSTTDTIAHAMAQPVPAPSASTRAGSRAA